MMKYICYYGNENCKEKRHYVLSATNKIDYISQVLKQNHDVEIISTSSCINKKSDSYRIQTKDGVSVLMPPSIGRKNKFTRFLDKIYIKKWLKKQLNSFNKNDDVIVYHSLGYMKTIEKAKKKRNFNLILEIEEIYGDVSGRKKDKKRELKFFKKADSYIFPTELLNDKVNLKNKPYVIIHGTYNVEKQISGKFNDGLIHCVYAGTFDPRKGGVYAAISASKFLDEKYCIHILGFGTEKEKRVLLEKIDEINNVSKCKVIYEGLLSGQDYIKFIQSCDIGLSTQNPDAEFNTTSFPSKVLSYISNGLRVVSIKIEVLENSAVNNLLYYYEENNPEAIANAIKSIDVSKSYDSRTKIEELNAKFTKEIKNLLELN